jgi:hypothetical protein
LTRPKDIDRQIAAVKAATTREHSFGEIQLHYISSVTCFPVSEIPQQTSTASLLREALDQRLRRG